MQMKKWQNIQAEELLTKIFQILCVGLFFILLYYSIGLTGENQDLAHEYIYFKPDSLLCNALGLCAAAVMVYGISRLTARAYGLLKTDRAMDRTALMVSIVIGILCILWVGASNTAPQADQSKICEYADAFNSGDYSGLAKGAYVGVYRQQLGMITLLRILFSVFGSGNYRAFQYFSAVMAAILVFCGYQVTKQLTENRRLPEVCYLILMLLCVPLYVYVPFVYGEIVSVTFVLFSTWMLLSCLKHFSWGRAAAFGLAAGIALQLRENTLIILIGFLLVLLIKLFAKRDRSALLLLCSLAVGVLLFQGIVTGIYRDKIPEDSNAMPFTLHIAMGCNWDGENPGWYNGYNWRTFQEYDCDPEAASWAAKETIAEFMETCREDHDYALSFFVTKMAAQWEAPMYQCLAMNNYIAGEQSSFADSVYYGNLREFAEGFMNIYQIVLYGAICYLLIAKWKKWNSIEPYVLLIAVYGGFLFTMMWEAKTRYVLPYLLCMIPYAAAGLGSIPFDKIVQRIFRRAE